jgi:nucleoside-diphosphate-sugar epimerase
MGMNIFVAGASGVIGRSLVPLLRDAGHKVTGTSRNAEGKAVLDGMGVRGVIADLFDPEGLLAAVVEASPDIVLHQVTDLAAGINQANPEEVIRRNARVRREGTENLVRAAQAAKAKRLVAQSIGWAYAAKDLPFQESDPLDVNATGNRSITVNEGIVPLETLVLGQPDIEGVILRFGQLYGKGTWSTEPTGASPVHVDAAAYAAFLAIDHGKPGIYNIAEPGNALDVDKAMSELAWRPDFRL